MAVGSANDNPLRTSIPLLQPWMGEEMNEGQGWSFVKVWRHLNLGFFPEYEGMDAFRCHVHTSIGATSDTLNLFSVD